MFSGSSVSTFLQLVVASEGSLLLQNRHQTGCRGGCKLILSSQGSLFGKARQEQLKSESRKSHHPQACECLCDVT